MRNKNHIRNRIFQLILATIISISTLLPLPVYGEAGEDTPIDLVYFIQIMDLVKNNYVHDMGKKTNAGKQGDCSTILMKIATTILRKIPELLEDISGTL